MPRGKKHGPETIIPKLREAEVLISQSTTQKLAAKKIEASLQTLIRWPKEYGGLKMDQTQRLKQLEQENAKLKKLLRGEGWRVNHKRIERLWRQEGLKVPREQPKRKRL